MRKGQSLIEILIAIGLTSLLLPALITAIVASREGKAQEGQRLQAVALLREAEDAIRVFRESDWLSFANNGTYHPEISGNTWTLESDSEVIDGFTRQIEISNTYRNSNGEIDESGVNEDKSTKKVLTTVSWETPVASLVESTNYYHRYLNNDSWTQTTEEQFGWGTLTNTVTTNNFGGEVELDASSGGDWATSVNVGQYNNGGNANGRDVFVDGGYAYLVTNNGGGNPDLAIIDISTPSSPFEQGTLNLSANVIGIHVLGNYAYLATAGNSSELTIVDISNKSSPFPAATVDLGAAQNAFDVYVSGNYAYVGKDSDAGSAGEFYIVDVSTPTSPFEVGSFEVGWDVNGVSVVGDYAYLSTDDNSRELLVVDVSTPSSPSEEGSYNANSGANGEDVFVSGSTAYLVTTNNTGGTDPEFYIINVSTPSSPSLVGDYDVTSAARGVFVSGNFAFIANDGAGREFIVLDISTSSNPSEYGTLDLVGDGNGVFVSGDYAYVASDNNSQELIVIEGGTGLAYVTSGTFESSTFDAGAEVAFNYLTFSITEPGTTNVVFELAINNDGSTWNYFGSYEDPGMVPLANIEGRYIRYRATLTGGSQTPIISDVSVNYSP